MNKKIREMIARVAIDTLQKLTFIFAMPEDEIFEIDRDNLVMAKVSFAGKFSGWMEMKISKHILPGLTINMLGIDDDESVQTEQQHDMLKETLNIICGNLLPEISDRASVFTIGSPEIVGEPYPERSDKMNRGHITTYLLLDEGQCSVSLFFDEGFQENG